MGVECFESRKRPKIFPPQNGEIIGVEGIDESGVQIVFTHGVSPLLNDNFAQPNKTVDTHAIIKPDGEVPPMITHIHSKDPNVVPNVISGLRRFAKVDNGFSKQQKGILRSATEQLARGIQTAARR